MSLHKDDSTFTRSCVKSVCFSEGWAYRFQRKAGLGSLVAPFSRATYQLTGRIPIRAPNRQDS
jgi:hypothetical protein